MKGGSGGSKMAQQAMHELELQKKKDQANLVTQLKKATDPNKMQVYNMYTALAKNSPEKSKILEKWLSDKSCQWSNEYSKVKTVGESRVGSATDGYGSK